MTEIINKIDRINLETERIIYSKQLKNVMVYITQFKNKTDNYCYVLLGDMWSIQKGNDLNKIIIGFEEQNYNIFKDVYSGCCLIGDLRRAKIINEEEYNKLIGR